MPATLTVLHLDLYRTGDQQWGAGSDAVVISVTAGVRLEPGVDRGVRPWEEESAGNSHDLHLYFYAAEVTDSGVQGSMQLLPELLRKLDSRLRGIKVTCQVFSSIKRGPVLERDRRCSNNHVCHSVVDGQGAQGSADRRTHSDADHDVRQCVLVCPHLLLPL